MTGMAKFSLLVLMLCFFTVLNAEGREFRLGIIGEKTVETKLQGYVHLTRYVAERLKTLGVTRGELVVTSNVDQMIQKIRKKEVDVVFESAFSTIKMLDKARMRPKLLVWKHGVKEYSTVFFVRNDSSIDELTDLQGKVVALQDPGSTTAFMIPIAELKRSGLKVVRADGKVPSTAVRYALAEHEKNQVFWVLEKRAAAGAFGSDDWDEVQELEKRGLKVIYKTEPVLRYIASFHPDLPIALTDSIVAIFAQMDKDPEGRKILEQASRIKKVEPLSLKDYQSLRYVRQLMKEM